MIAFLSRKSRQAHPELTVLLVCRTLRGFGDGLISLILPAYLTNLGFGATQTGALVTASLLGTAFFTLLAGIFAYRFSGRSLLISASILMVFTGGAFSLLRDFWPLLLVAILGTLNPSASDFSKFLPMEHAHLTRVGADRDRTTVFAWYSLLGVLGAAFGALAAGAPELMSGMLSVEMRVFLQGAFVVYGLIGAVTLILYRGLPAEIPGAAETATQPLRKSRRIVFTLAALFGLDAFAGGMVAQSLLALWLFERFGLSLGATGLIFFWSGLLTAFSFLAAPRIAGAIGLLNTMVFTHLPANICLLLVPFMPSAMPAIALLLVRSMLVQIDVPARNSFLMSVVTPGERAAAASVAAVPRSLAASASPLLAGALFALSPFGWPLVVAGGLKILYDVLLLGYARKILPPSD